MTTMMEVDVILDMPNYCLRYDDAHDLMEKFVKKHKGKIKSGRHMALSFRHTMHDMVSESFLIGLGEYINANSHVRWSVHAASTDAAQILTRLAPDLNVMQAGVTPYVKRKPLTL